MKLGTNQCAGVGGGGMGGVVHLKAPSPFFLSPIPPSTVEVEVFRALRGVQEPERCSGTCEMFKGLRGVQEPRP